MSTGSGPAHPGDGISRRRAAFRTRDCCPLCGGASATLVWCGRFCDDPVRSWLKRSCYDADLDEALADESFERVACVDCGMTFHRRVLDEPWLGVLYGRWINSQQIDAFEKGLGENVAERTFSTGVQQLKHVLRLRHLLSGGGPRPLRLLDFGCGDGGFLTAAKLLGMDGYGVDFSESRRERASRAGLDTSPDLATLDLRASKEFDAVTMFEVLEHVADPAGLLDVLARRVRRGGVLLVEVPDCRGIAKPRDYAEFSNVHPLEHLNHFTPATLHDACRRAGFVPVRRVPAHVTTSPLDVLRTEASRVLRGRTTSVYCRRA